MIRRQVEKTRTGPIREGKKRDENTGNGPCFRREFSVGCNIVLVYFKQKAAVLTFKLFIEADYADRVL